MPALKYKQHLLDSDIDEMPRSFLGRAIAGKSAATTLLEVSRTLVGADPSVGSGLVGLTDRVEALGGSIRVESPPGDGTRIGVVLPIEPDVRE